MQHLGEGTRRALREALQGAKARIALYALCAELTEGMVREEFAACARQETALAGLWLRLLRAHGAPEAADCLEEAVRAERRQWAEALPEQIRLLRGEGQEALVDRLEKARQVSRAREERLQSLLRAARQGELYDRREPALWTCARCGWAHLSARAPAACPLCGAARSAFRPKS